MSDALELLPADYWRWYLMANAPESDDASFTWELFGDAVNKDLVGTFGNFVNRTVTQVVRHFGEQVPVGGAPGATEAELAQRAEARLAEYVGHLDALEFRKAAAALRALWAEGNLYRSRPSTEDDRSTDRTACTLRTALGLVLAHSLASAPFVPATAERPGRSRRGQGSAASRRQSGRAASEVLRPGADLVPSLLFRKLDPDEARVEQRQRGRDHTGARRRAG